ncbi:hypothetical protein [Catenulispora rubra]|uniref:hypothetical protein n=1 Tax=Catenulispora rubra TaxID=280293 RepID=UPI001892590B|nr:hypothetical protein [Catenulispora rubra]
MPDATSEFIDHWIAEEPGSLGEHFAEAVDSARWGDNPRGGTLANKYRITLITDEVLDAAVARRLAEELLAANDPRIADPHGPAGAIEVTSGEEPRAWILFGRSRSHLSRHAARTWLPS